MTAPASPDGAASQDGAAQQTAADSRPSGDSQSRDTLGRIREGGDFAVEQYRTTQSRADKAETELQKINEWLGGLKSYREQNLQGDQLVPYLRAAEVMLSNEDTRQMLNAIVQTGKLPEAPRPTGNGADGDDLLDPEQKQIRELQTQLAALQNRLGQSEFAAGQDKLTQHLERVEKELGDGVPDAIRQKLRQGVAEQVRTWQQLGDAGQRAIATLHDPDKGFDTVKALALGRLSMQELQEVFGARENRHREGLAGLATDVPGGTVSTGTEPPPHFDSASEAMVWAYRNPEKHDST